MNMTKQSIMLSSYASGEILSARRKADNGCPKGDVIGKQTFQNEARSVSWLLVTGDTPTVTAAFRLANTIEFHQTGN